MSRIISHGSLRVEVRHEHWPGNSPRVGAGWGLYADGALLCWSASELSDEFVRRRVGEYVLEGR